MFRARRLEKALGTPARIYYKYVRVGERHRAASREEGWEAGSRPCDQMMLARDADPISAFRLRSFEFQPSLPSLSVAVFVVATLPPCVQV